MMLISLGAVLIAWVAIIWRYDPEGLQRTAHKRSVPRDGKISRYY